MKRLLLVAAPAVLVLVAAAAGAMLVLGDAASEPRRKLAGTPVPLADDFTISLADGRYARLSVALVLSHAPHGELEQETAVRAVITDELTGLDAAQLVERPARRRVQRRILRALRGSTDVDVHRVLFTDIAVQ